MYLSIDSFKLLITEIVNDIANKNYDNLVYKNVNGRVNVNDLKRVVDEYGCTIIPLPDGAFELAETYFIETENRLDIYLPLWTKEEGRSDLTLSLSAQKEGDKLSIEINDLRVL